MSEIIGKKVAQYLEAGGSLSSLAEFLGVTTKTITNWCTKEYNLTNVNQLNKLALVLDSDLTELTGIPLPERNSIRYSSDYSVEELKQMHKTILRKLDDVKYADKRDVLLKLKYKLELFIVHLSED